MLQKITRSLLRNSRTFRMMPSLVTRINYKFSEDSHPDFQATQKAPISESTLKEKQSEIDKIVKGNKVVLFMKGTPAAPMCGYSNYAVQVLQFYKVNGYHSVDVLADSVMREEVKKYSNWPTFPQLYVNHELVGGCDIMMEMHKDGSLKDLFGKL